ncbi:hypothetical protein Rhe02_02180 [Rhizocola hellebori]|uniref:Zinc ribbon domain-containing protein n=1 Tax=Rhizocola hellebori TaxID=1392758 RepID=A0A8J3Q2G6_9ACTN|nr:hypothetical protein Rhe02_02180 [Rhizocola hellebori]
MAVQRQVAEHSFTDLRPRQRAAAQLFSCPKCAAQTESDALSERCPFCTTPLVGDAQSIGQIAPEAVVPFDVDQAAVRDRLRQWISTRWFAPSSLRQVGVAESVRSVYLPHWTLDSQTASDYTGQRGDDYWATESYTTTVNGQSQTQTRQVRRTRWRPASGSVSRRFDDVLVPATRRVDSDHLHDLMPWPLPQAKPYQPEYLSGHQTLRYEVEPEAALEQAKQQMAAVIHEDCEQDIGGDHQRVSNVDTQYTDVTYKLMLLPVWIVCYLHAGKSWQVYVNGSSGSVTGQRPYSTAKIAAAITVGLALIGLLVFLFTRN